MRLNIVQPKPDAPEQVKRAFGHAVPGSVFVLVERHGVHFVYYEGGIYTRDKGREPTKDERISYAKHAADRATWMGRGYPTIAFFGLIKGDEQFLDTIGEVDTDTWGVTFR